MQRCRCGAHIRCLLWVGNGSGIGLLESVGTQTQDSSTPVTTDTIFRIYSMTKPIISVAAMSLVESGQLSLDDPVSDYLPSFSVCKDRQCHRRYPTGQQHHDDKAFADASIRHRPAALAMNTPLGLCIVTAFRMFDTTDPTQSAPPSWKLSTPSAHRTSQLGSVNCLYCLNPGCRHYGHSTDVLGAVLEVASKRSTTSLKTEFLARSAWKTPAWVDEKDASRCRTNSAP